jgi:hypothetical protein
MIYSVSKTEYNDLMNAQYKIHLQGVDRLDEEAMNQAMRPIRDDLAQKDVEGVQDRKTISGFMRAAKHQLTNLVSFSICLVILHSNLI